MIEILQNFERVLWNHISVNILNGVMIKEEAMIIKEQLHNSEFDDFSASDGWLDCWKTYSVKERCIVGETRDVSTERVFSLDAEEKQIDWKLLIGKHFEYGRIRLFF